MYLVTAGFPCAAGEQNFILPELEALKKRFDITIISCVPKEYYNSEKLDIEVDKDIEIVRIDRYRVTISEYIKYFVSFWRKKDCRTEIINILSTSKMRLRKIWKSIQYYAVAEHMYNQIDKRNIIAKDENAIFYSYWYNEKVLGMALHRESYPNLKVITRAHGFDLYDERVYKIQRQPFKQVADSKLDQIIFISKHGYEYYLQHYASDISAQNKYAIFYLGVTEKPYNPGRMKKNPLLLISCAEAKPLKRIDYIIRALAGITEYDVKWVHFGGGHGFENLLLLAKQMLGSKRNIVFELKGRMDNSEIMSYYETEEPSCFITTSSTEGSPVSMQEALAFGIPVIGTAVGGIPEMIDYNGVLLDANPTIEQVSEAIHTICRLSEEQYSVMCNRSYEIWKETFNQKGNVERFIDYIES